MASLTDRPTWDSVNQSCYDHCYQYWDRFPFPDILPHWLMSTPYKGGTFLDIGSGTGQFAKWLQEQGYTVTCLDPSSAMVRQCQAKGLTCMQTTFQDYREEQTYSMICAILSFIHIPKNEWPLQLARVAQYLAADGLFCLALIEGKGEGMTEQSAQYPRYFAYFTRNEIERLTLPHFELLRFTSVPAPCGSYLLFLFRKARTL